MSARRYSQFAERAIKEKGSPPPTGRRGKQAQLPEEKPVKWQGMKGTKHSDRGLGYPLVKTFVAGEYMAENPGGSSFPSGNENPLLRDPNVIVGPNQVPILPFAVNNAPPPGYPPIPLSGFGGAAARAAALGLPFVATGRTAAKKPRGWRKANRRD